VDGRSCQGAVLVRELGEDCPGGVADDGVLRVEGVPPVVVGDIGRVGDDGGCDNSSGRRAGWLKRAY